MHYTPEVNHQPDHQTACLDFVELRHQLDVLVTASDMLRAQLETQRDEATQRGDALEARALERGVLQVTRVRNEVSCASRQLDPITVRGTRTYARHAA